MSAVMSMAELRAQVAELLGDTPGDDDDLLDHGMDSIRLMTLADRLGLDFMELAERPTLRAWGELIRG
ncbi:isochorismatase [Nonomuraea sp. NN258]|uniref:phosphopantetheine-binding protein n=1 Tax=Nonomuraea antri TaxID=2730852 RepID=UPI0015698909|nr:phosphopantetheine-binding protein [Nonomuraea antri]NRQ31991.1 isochorismatase [Nonomuraea antri]